MSAMHTSIWQQWASNHSGYFKVIGIFKTSTDADAAAAEIRRLLQGLVDWYSDPANLEALEQGLLDDDRPFAPIERQYLAKYGIDEDDWTYCGGIDWITEPEHVDKALSVLENKVFISKPDDTWQPGPPMNILLEQLDADRVLWDSHVIDSSRIGFSLAFTAPDESTAEGIVDAFNAFFETNDYATIKSLGLGHMLGYELRSKGKARREGARVFVDRVTLTEWLPESILEITSTLEEHGFRDVVYDLEEYRIVDFECNAPDGDTANEIYEMVAVHLGEGKHAPFITPWGSTLWQGSVALDGQHLVLSELGFGISDQSVQGMLDYLKRKGCTNISWKAHKMW
jgi:hypothetical protein